MQLITSTGFAEQTINKSQFIAAATPCDNEQMVAKALRQLVSEHQNAHHLAYAFRLKTPEGIIHRYSDAGEPSGTAGMPIYKHLEGRDLINVCVGVIRYYGGINLGTGGLARAYGGTAKMALDQVQTMDFVEMDRVKLTIDYNQMDSVSHALNQINGKILDKQFTDKIQLILQLPATESAQFIKRFNPY